MGDIGIIDQDVHLHGDKPLDQATPNTSEAQHQDLTAGNVIGRDLEANLPIAFAHFAVVERATFGQGQNQEQGMLCHGDGICRPNDA